MRLARLTLPLTNHHAILGRFLDRGAATRIFAALQLFSVATNSLENNRPSNCWTTMPNSSSEPAPRTQFAKGRSSSGPSFTADALTLRRPHSSRCLRTRSGSSRATIVGKRRPSNESTASARLRSNRSMGHPPESNLRSIRVSRARASISVGSLTSNRSMSPGIALLFNGDPLTVRCPSASGVLRKVQRAFLETRSASLDGHHLRRHTDNSVRGTLSRDTVGLNIGNEIPVRIGLP